MICCSRWSPQKWSLPKNPTYRNKTLWKMHYFQLFMWDVFSGARKYCASFTVERLFCEVDIGITWWIERVATWGRFIIQMLRRLCWDNNIADSRNFLHWILDVVELLRWISPEWIHRELQNKLSTKPQGKHWSSLKPIKLPLGTLPLLSGFKGWVLPMGSSPNRCSNFVFMLFYLRLQIPSPFFLVNLSKSWNLLCSTHALYFHLYHNEPPITCFI